MTSKRPPSPKITSSKKLPPSPIVRWEMISQLMYAVMVPIKGSPNLVITFNPAISPYLVAVETSAKNMQSALDAHKHQMLGPVSDFKEAMIVAEKFGNEWLRGKGFPSSDCACDDIHPGTKLRPVRGTKRKKA